MLRLVHEIICSRAVEMLGGMPDRDSVPLAVHLSVVRCTRNSVLCKE